MIPLRLDSIIRVENVVAGIQVLLNHFKTNVIVLEAASHCNHILEKLLPEEVQYEFCIDDDPIFHRTKYINQIAKCCQTPIIAIWDADVILPPRQIASSIRMLRKQNADVVFPYDGHFYDTTKIIRELFIENNYNIDFLLMNIDKMLLPYGSSMGGGALFIQNEAFQRTGGEDERFYGWGPEDWNRIEKWRLYSLKIRRVRGPLFHLTHPRDINGQHATSLQKHWSFYYLNKTLMSTIEDIQRT